MKKYIFCLKFLKKGITTQTILTIPVNHQINSNEQFVQTLAALNNCAATQQLKHHQKQQESSLQISNLLPQIFSHHSEKQKKQEQGLSIENFFYVALDLL